MYTVGILLSAFLFFGLIEYWFQSSSVFRAFLFFAYILICLFVLYRWIIDPLITLLVKKKQISDDEAALQIGGFFPEVKDKLVNLIQLQRLKIDQNTLIAASVGQKAGLVNTISFNDAISFKENVRYIKYLVIPFIFIAAIALFKPAILTESTDRIVHFNKKYIPRAPFRFVIKGNDLIAFRNEDFDLNLVMEGNSLPENVYLLSNGRKIKLQRIDDQHFKHTFEKIQQDAQFHFEAAGFASSSYKITVVGRPNIQNFDVQLVYPHYLDKKMDRA